MSTIPKQNLIIDDTIDIGLSADLINGTYKTASLTDLSNNVYTKISDLSSNVYTSLNSKQSNITASTSLSGVGTNITALNYNNITVNKPTYFPSDYNTTVVNKPDLSVYAIKSNVDSSLNTINATLLNKQNNFTVSTPLIKSLTENITIDLSAYPLKTYVDGSLNTINTNLSNKQNTITVATPLIKDVSNNITIDLSAYPLKTYVDGSLNTINTNLSNKQNTISVTTPLKKDVSNNLSIDLSGYTLLSSFNTLSTTVSGKENALTFSTPLTRNTNTIGIDLSGYAMTSALASYLPLGGGTMTGDLTFNKTNLNIQLSGTNGNNIGIPSVAGNFSTSASAGDLVIRSANTLLIQSGVAGAAIKIPPSNSVSIPTLETITSFKYQNTELSTTLATKESILTFNTPLSRATNTISIDLSSYLTSTTAASTYLKLDGSSTMSANPLKLSSATVAAPATGVSGSTGDRIILYQGGSLTYPYSLGINSGTLWYSVPSTAVHNFYVNGTSIFTISSGGIVSTGPIGGTVINEGGVAISTKYLSLGGGTLTGALTGTTINATSFVEGGTALSSKYLSSASLSNYILKAGDTMTGALNITSTTTDNQLIITNTSTNRYASIKFYNGTQTGYIGIGCTVVGGTYQGNLFLETTNSIVFATGGYNTTSTPPRMILTSAGNLGIGVASPSVKLEVRGGTIQGEQLYVVDSASYGANQYGLLINAPTSTQGASIQTIQQSVGYNQNLMLQQTGSGYVYLGGSLTTGLRIAGWDTGNTLYQNTGNMGITVNTGNNITFNVGNGGEKMRVNSGGNIGIGTNNPNTRLHIEHASTSANASAGGLYLYNPNIGANNCSILGVRLKGGTTSYSGNRCGISMDIDGYYGWNIGINDNDRTDKKLRFNASWDNNGTDRMTLDYNGNFAVGGSMSGGALTSSGIANIHNGSPYAVPNNFMASGSLTIGGTTANYGGTTNWTSSTAGLMMECADNTEITIHDSGNRLASFMLYNGGATAQFNMGANKGWGTVKCNMVGGLKINNIDTPLTNANTQYLAGNPTTYTIYNKGYPFCLFYVTVGSNFGIYLGTNITAGSSFAPGLIYNGGITYYVPYFTNQVGNGTIMWIYNASGGVQVSCFEMWFN